MAYIPLFISLVALAVAIIALLVAQKAKDKTNSVRIRHYDKEEFESYFDEYVEQKVRRCIGRERERLERNEISSQATPDKTEQLIASDLCSAVIEQTTPDNIKENEAESDGSRNNQEEISLPAPIAIYVGSYKTGSFKYNSPTPDGKTIYCITAGDKEAEEGVINIEQSAYDKVAETPDYLEGACIISGNGTQIQVCKPGTVSKENGQWIVKEQIEVELV